MNKIIVFTSTNCSPCQILKKELELFENIEYINVSGVRRNGIKVLLKAPFKIVHAIYQALKVVKKFKPDVVLGMGGYASGPGGVAAKL